MKYRLLIFTTLLALISFLGWRSLHGFHRGPRISGAFAQDAYVWQRDWNGPVQTAVRESQAELPIKRLVVLSRQISWDETDGRVTRIAVNWESFC